MQETETYKGLSIVIDNDISPENPYTSWDGNTPLMYQSGRNRDDYSKGGINEYLSKVLTDGQIIRHQKKLYDYLELEPACDETPTDEKIDYIRDEILNTSSYEGLEMVCKLSKTPYMSTSRTGYSQGDYAEIFMCYTEDFNTETGCEKSRMTEEYFDDSADLWASWAYGDVYIFTIEETDDCCGGFYGTDHEKSGLLDHARSSIDCYLSYLNEKKVNKVKQLITARVPLQYRPQQIANFQI